MVFKSATIFDISKTKNMTTTTQSTAVFEVKVSGKWSKVRATSIKALDTWCMENGIAKWRMMGMMSIAETLASKSINTVA